MPDPYETRIDPHTRTVIYWNVYRQRWDMECAESIPDAILATFNEADREAINAAASEWERERAPAHYTLPHGWTWADVARERRRWDHPIHTYPLACAGGVVAWGRPLPQQSTR